MKPPLPEPSAVLAPPSAGRPIVHVKIYPGIGIARVGNSPDEFFVGPEVAWEEPPPSMKYKDARGRVKRQAARFRIYGYDAQGAVVQELTAADCTINWTAHLKNKKASYYKFAGRFHQHQQADNLRNQTQDNADTRLPDERTEWIIDPGPRAIAGRHQPAVLLDGGKIKGTEVVLGELQTDGEGRLLVLGGYGTSASLIANNPIKEYANSNDWYDDTSDGCITATVAFADGRRLAAESAWVIVAPPKYAPTHYNLVSLYDRIRSVSDKAAVEAEPTAFYQHIYPIFYRAANYAWVNDMAHRGHAAGTHGNFVSPQSLAILSSPADTVEVPVPATKDTAASTRTVNARAVRQGVLQRMRKPVEWEQQDNASPPVLKDEAKANAQANYNFMPQLSGDDGDVRTYPQPKEEKSTHIEALTWLTLLPSQYRHLENWATGDFVLDAPEQYKPLHAYPLAEQPAALDRGVLEYCVGGPFYPGIEMTFIADEEATFRAPFRIVPKQADGVGFGPGDVTRYMALPWQADFFECNTHWWPAQRPDDVVTEASFAEAQQNLLHYPATGTAGSVYAQALAERERWARGVADDPADNITGDNNMVKYWHELGFITKRQVRVTHASGDTYQEEVYVEQERAPNAGVLSGRDYFYKLQHIDHYPELLPKAKDLVEQTLAEARVYGREADTPEQLRYFTYTPEAFEARMMDAYNSFVREEEDYSAATDPTFTSREATVMRIRQMAPFNLTDGAWLRHIDTAGPTDQVQSFLSSIFQDERGNGDPAMNHASIYLSLCNSVGFYPPPMESEAFAQSPDFLDSAFTVPVFELAISQFSETYLPELLGMTLFLEWSVLELKPTIALLEYYGIDPHFYVMHVGIDNAVNGHGRRAMDAIQLYLDEARLRGGEPAVQAEFERIWSGYVAFSLAGTLADDLKNMLQQPPSYHDQMVAMVQRKAQFGSLNHDKHMLGANRINDWFSEPAGFLQALIDGGYIVPGNIAGSKFFSLLEFANGPMFRVFTDDEKQLWKDWTLSLASPPPPPPLPSPPPPLVAYHNMDQVITVLRNQQTGSAQHHAMMLRQPGTDEAHPISWWFEQPNADFMAALAYPANGLIVAYDPDNSLFITQLISPANRMGQAFNYVVEGTGKTGRQIAIDWVLEGCPLRATPTTEAFAADTVQLLRAPLPPVTEKLWLTSSLKKVQAQRHRKIRGMGTIH